MMGKLVRNAGPVQWFFCKQGSSGDLGDSVDLSEATIKVRRGPRYVYSLKMAGWSDLLGCMCTIVRKVVLAGLRCEATT